MKKVMAASILALGLALTGCGGNSPSNPGDSKGQWRSTGDGRVIYCISVAQTLSCDWENAKRENDVD